MRNVVFVRRPGGYKEDDAWCCSSEGEAEALRRFLHHVGVRSTQLMSLDQHEKLPDRQPEAAPLPTPQAEVQHELTAECITALNAWLGTTRGAHFMGAGCVITRSGNGSFDLVPNNPSLTFTVTVALS